MPKVGCAIVGCSNSTYRINKWKNEICDLHNVQHRDCECPRPFRLHMFPSELRNGERRMEWVRACRRDTSDHKNWKPGKSDRVCSEHFIDEEPTLEHPIPTEKLGYTPKSIKPRRSIIKYDSTSASQSTSAFVNNSGYVMYVTIIRSAIKCIYLCLIPRGLSQNISGLRKSIYMENKN